MTDDMYEVEAIVGKIVQHGVVLYTVKWKGYPHEENTNEPLANLGAPLIERLEKQSVLNTQAQINAVRQREAKQRKTQPLTSPTTSTASVETGICHICGDRTFAADSASCYLDRAHRFCRRCTTTRLELPLHALLIRPWKCSICTKTCPCPSCHLTVRTADPTPHNSVPSYIPEPMKEDTPDTTPSAIWWSQNPNPPRSPDVQPSSTHVPTPVKSPPSVPTNLHSMETEPQSPSQDVSFDPLPPNTPPPPALGSPQNQTDSDLFRIQSDLDQDSAMPQSPNVPADDVISLNSTVSDDVMVVSVQGPVLVASPLRQDVGVCDSSVDVVADDAVPDDVVVVADNDVVPVDADKPLEDGAWHAVTVVFNQHPTAPPPPPPTPVSVPTPELAQVPPPVRQVEPVPTPLPTAPVAKSSPVPIPVPLAKPVPTPTPAPTSSPQAQVKSSPVPVPVRDDVPMAAPECEQGDKEAEAVDDDLYEVEAVLAERSLNGTNQYLIKWVGYAEEEWVDEANMVTCDALLATFRANSRTSSVQPEQPTRKRPSELQGIILDLEQALTGYTRAPHPRVQEANNRLELCAELARAQKRLRTQPIGDTHVLQESICEWLNQLNKL